MLKNVLFFLLFFNCFILLSQVNNPKNTKSLYIEKINDIKEANQTNPQKAIFEYYILKKEIEKKGSEYDMYLMSYELALIYMNNTGEFEKVVEEANFLLNYAKQIKDHYGIADALQMRGVSYIKLNFSEEGIKDLQDALIYLDAVPKSNDVYVKFCVIYNNLSYYYEDKNDLVNELFNLNKSLEYALMIGEQDVHSLNYKMLLLAFLYSQFGDYDYKIDKKSASKTNYEKSLQLFENYGNKYTVYGKVHVLSQFSSVNYEEGNYKDAIEKAIKAVEIQKGQTDSAQLINLYDVLQKSYLKLGNTDSASYYMDLYTKTHNAFYAKTSNIQNRAITNYTKKLKSNENIRIRNIIFISLIAIVLISFSIFFYFRKKQKKQKSIYEQYIEKLKIVEKEEENSDKDINSSSITDETLNNVINKLASFEKKEKFLNKNLTLASLATDLKINTKYLSQIINEHKGKNFNNYINSLRIEYLTRKLIEDQEYSKYKIAYLADISGFGSREVFALAFKKETGVSPSFFIKQLKHETV